MITRTYARSQSGHPCEPLEHRQTIGDALVDLVQYQLGYGGHVVAAEPTSVQVVTRVLSCTDTVTWEGPATEMQPLLTVAACWLQLVAAGAQKKVTEAMATPLVEQTGGKALLLRSLGPVAVGSRLASYATMAAMADDEADLGRMRGVRLGDLVALYAMCVEDGIAFKQIAEVLL